MEYADGGTLRDYLKNNIHSLTWENKYRLAYQLACSILCLHEEGIVHRDLVIFFFFNIKQPDNYFLKVNLLCLYIIIAFL
jgi:serine/threonine protein kinase